MSLLQKYNEYFAKHDGKIIKYTCPNCKERIKTLHAENNRIWHTLSTCPFCENMHMKITSGDIVTIKEL